MANPGAWRSVWNKTVWQSCWRCCTDYGGLQMSDQDVFVNVVGGVKVTETSADLALLLAMVSSLRDRPLPQGSGGVWRKWGWRDSSGAERAGKAYFRAAKHGFRRAIVCLPPTYRKSRRKECRCSVLLKLRNALACLTTYNSLCTAMLYNLPDGVQCVLSGLRLIRIVVGLISEARHRGSVMHFSTGGSCVIVRLSQNRD